VRKAAFLSGGRSRLTQCIVLGALAGTILLAGLQATQTAVANGDTRTIRLYHAHTRESITVTFKREGRYDDEALKQLNWFLRDWRIDKATRMEPRLFDILWEVYREVGATEPINVVSAYRAPQTNSMLRSRSKAVAEHSQHMLGRAMDFYIPGVPIARIREVGLRLQQGGVGYYPTSGSPFVHLDAGNVRMWPRMTRPQLARIFPDGRTVHIPSDGKPMPGYALALADVQSHGATTGRKFDFTHAGEVRTASNRNFFERLFGVGRDEDEDEDVAPARVRATAVAANKPGTPPATARQVAAVAPAAPVPAMVPAAPATPKPAPATAMAAAAVPVPSNRPAALLLASAAPAEPLPAPAGPRMVWTPGAQPAAAAASAAGEATPVVHAPAMPAPRPGSGAPALKPDPILVAFAASEPKLPFPALIPQAQAAAIPASNGGGSASYVSPLPTPRPAPHSAGTAVPAKAPAAISHRIAMAFGGDVRTRSGVQEGRASAAALVSAPLDPAALRAMVSRERAVRDKATAILSHPDQDGGGELLRLPVRVLATTGTLNESNNVGFRGSAVSLLPTHAVEPSGATTGSRQTALRDSRG